MKGDKTVLNGQLTGPDTGLDTDLTLSANFVYQRMHTLGREALHAKTHVQLLDQTYHTLYGAPSGLTATMLASEVALLLESNRYPLGDNLVNIYLFPGDESGPARVLSCEKQLLYKGYTLWHTPAKAIVIPLEYPLPHFKTAVSLAANTYATNYAQRHGADCALAQNAYGQITGAGEHPLFAVQGNKVVTPALGEGACDSVERRLGIMAAEAVGLTPCEKTIQAAELHLYDELFFVTPQGVTGIRSCDGRLYPNSTARVLARQMEPMIHIEL